VCTLISAPDDDLLPQSLVFLLPDIDEAIRGLGEKRGREFEEAVRDAMKCLDLDTSLTETTEAESDVVVEALHAEAPFFVVVECQAVHEGSQIGVDKVGQIRGNAASYLDTRRQQLFDKYYKLVVGKPEFSNHAKERALPDVGLLSVETLIRLLRLHEKYYLSQNVLQEIFEGTGEIDVDKVNSVVRQYLRRDRYFRRLEIYSLIYAALLKDPFSDRTEQRKKWTPLGQIVAEVVTYGKMFRIRDLTPNEVALLARDLDNPFIRIVESRGSEIRLSTISEETIQNFGPLGEDLVSKIRQNLHKLRTLEL
jgi:hypothetical protein